MNTPNGKDGQILFSAVIQETLCAPELIAAWEAHVRTNSHVNSLYGSPAWAAHLAATSTSRVEVIFMRDRDERLTGVLPFRVRSYALRFDVSKTSLLRKALVVAEILGGIPLLSKCRDTHQRVLREIFTLCPEVNAVLVDSLPVDSHFWTLLHDRHSWIQEPYYIYQIDDPRPWHLLNLAPSFEQYLKSLSSKARANMRREVRQLAEWSGGDLAAVRVSAPDQIPWFLTQAARVGANSWQRRALGERVRCDEASRQSFRDLAICGILRCYVLQAGDAPLAFVIGYQYAGVYHYSEIAFDEAYTAHSPGKVLLTLMLEDLHAYDPPQVLNFGVGDASYKRRFGNAESTDVSCLIVRKRLSNKILTSSHRVFSLAVKTAKALIGRKVVK